MGDVSSLKVLLIGDSGVGKTALLRQYCDQKFSEDVSSTIGVDYRTKRVNFGDKTITLQLWDTAGQERFRNITTSYYRGSQGILIVYDVSNFDSLKQVTYWIGELKKENVDGMIFLVGNKIDVIDSLTKEHEDIIKTINLPHFTVSAKTGEGVQDLFTQLVKSILEKGLVPEPVGEMEEVSLEKESTENKGCC
ncbi:hypothetical protein, conserved [Entamoeba dispar SAW760]|uniref:Uncharacterized protein n=1 Tax=Entamoeba dispar (strain ATCC PRA-260 / SAW760) TaxID=370354 RepID=B0EQW5_ENTDS|nr:uncharacterized protein EDI_099280 [Entamoeba dispar SAW760]EDR23078.1 hypothetical protein, conserved [Entamoeba dispar SAW760]|eukprot:EDR23078.1 hypothetical protein, conserved [Entamoeba dispar SAW760]